MATEKTIALTIQTSVLFNGFVIAFLPKSNCLLISLLQSPSAVIIEPKKRKSVTTSTFSLSICLKVMELDAMILGFFFLIFSFKAAFSLSSVNLIKGLFSSSMFSAQRRQGQPTPVLLPGKSHGWRSLVGCNPWGR